tara:strand:- start:233 stop:430 length:198 start_codon:yes stop_codon:yes gene_type:complete
MPYNPNNPSNWSWSRAFDEVAKSVRKAEIEQQIMNHLDNYSGDPKWTNFTDDQKDDHYTILTEIL